MTKHAAAVVVTVAGALFGLGLVVGGMTQPGKVIAFLDVGGHWDPSLAFVMGGAVLTYFPLHRVVLRRPTPLFRDGYRLPTRKDVDGKLLWGSGLFGIGWGLGGFCPGPALVSIGALSADALLFVAAMLAGMGLHRWRFGRASDTST